MLPSYEGLDSGTMRRAMAGACSNGCADGCSASAGGLSEGMDNAELEKIFVGLGHSAKNAAYYAKADGARETLIRSTFLHMLWELVIDETSYRDGLPAWIEAWTRSQKGDDAPTWGVGAAMKRVLDKGVDPEDLTDIVRAEQFEVIYNVCQLLDGDWLDEVRSRFEEFPEFSWRLCEVRVDEDYKAHPVAPIEDLHSELGDLDPAGRGGDPRKR